MGCAGHRPSRPETSGAGRLARVLGLALCVLLSACQRAPQPAAPVTLGNREGGPKLVVEPARPAPSETVDIMTSTYWPPAKLELGTARISCGYDYVADGDGEPLGSLSYFGLVDALSDCRSTGVVRLRYEGRIGAGFTDLLERVTAMAARMEIPNRVLDISSAGGHVEEAIRAGDAIADHHWTLWVREGSICHSACVLLLAGGDTRSIEGKVGIHRLIRDRSRANSRAELRAELREVHGQVTEYLERNGASAALADVMMTVPNRKLRLLTAEELDRFGLDGTNAAQDDLDRIVVARKCGDAFMRRRDAFIRAYDAQCVVAGKAAQDAGACGTALQERFGFPDPACPDDGPMAVVTRRTAVGLPAYTTEPEGGRRHTGAPKPAGPDVAGDAPRPGSG